jgi:hypothetical protein
MPALLEASFPLAWARPLDKCLMVGKNMVQQEVTQLSSNSNFQKHTSDHPIASKFKVQEILQFSWCLDQTSLVLIQKDTSFAKV